MLWRLESLGIKLRTQLGRNSVGKIRLDQACDGNRTFAAQSVGDGNMVGRPI